MDDINIADENLEEISCLIKFILILDNSGKSLYSIYYTDKYKTIESKTDFEIRLSKISTKYSVEKNDLDIFNYENYNIICKIYKEIAIFIGQDEEDNEILLEQFFNSFESILYKFVGNDLSREKIFEHYKDIIILIDEMIVGGILLNIDEDNLIKRINNSGKIKISEEKEKEGGGGLISGFFGYFSRKK